MNITKELVEDYKKVAKEYDSTSDMTKRVELGQKLDDLTSSLSEKQVKQFTKIVGSSLL